MLLRLWVVFPLQMKHTDTSRPRRAVWTVKVSSGAGTQRRNYGLVQVLSERQM